MNSCFSKKATILPVMAGALISVFIFVAFFVGIKKEVNRIEQQEKLNTLEKSIKYKSKFESTVYSKIILINGYLAYVKANPNLSQEETTEYLSYLIDANDKLVKNISILKDTTIIWAYPLKGNEKAIGKNIAEIPEQRESVLKTKNYLKPVFQGPVNLIQGGSGFISRIPVTIKDGTYWGQISLVIDGEELLKESGFYEDENDLEVAIFNKADYPNKPFWGNVNILNQNPLTFDMNFQDADWKIAIIPKSGWDNTTKYSIYWYFAALLTSIIIGILTFLIICARYRLKYQAIYDSLTGVFNRNYLYEYLVSNLNKTKNAGEFIVLFLIDLNDFKIINDTYGHNAGDKVLKVTAERLTLICGKSGEAIRLGGDEFLMIISDIKKSNNIEKIKMDINSAFYEEIDFEGYKLKISASIGNALYPTDGDTIDALINIADNRMYEEKRKNKN